MADYSKSERHSKSKHGRPFEIWKSLVFKSPLYIWNLNVLKVWFWMVPFLNDGLDPTFKKIEPLPKKLAGGHFRCIRNGWAVQASKPAMVFVVFVGRIWRPDSGTRLGVRSGCKISGLLRQAGRQIQTLTQNISCTLNLPLKHHPHQISPWP